MITPVCIVLTAKTGHLDPVYWGRDGVASLSSVHNWVKGQNVCVVNYHWLISSMVKQSRAILQCSQAVRQEKWQSKFLDPGLSCYGAYGSDHPCYACLLSFDNTIKFPSSVPFLILKYRYPLLSSALWELIFWELTFWEEPDMNYMYSLCKCWP